MKSPSKQWEYMYSEELEMEYAYHKKSGAVMTADKVVYSRGEVKALKGIGITKEVHMVKKLFGGEIVCK